MRYICIESFDTKYDWYGKDCGKGGIVNIGDVYILIREPTPKKKFYKLKPEVNNNRFNEGYLYLRKNFLKNHFKQIN